MIEAKPKAHRFLEGGGHMGALVRDHDWASTPLGPVEQWPQSLRTMVDVILHSDAPMLLWWGEDLIQFYNDAFRASLGESGKHPEALGQRGEECWPEIWTTIKPFIEHVRAGGAVWKKDQLIPIYRNGRIEDVYWTFGYSAVRDEDGNIAGVLVICSETTDQVLAHQRAEQNEATLQNIILHAPVAMCILRGPNFVLEISNEAMFRLWGKERYQLLGKPIFESMPEVRHQGFEEILNHVYSTGESFSAEAIPINLVRQGVMETVFVNFLYEPYRELNETVSGVLAVATDITEQVKAQQKVARLVTERTKELADSNNNLRRSNEELAQFAYIASHDLQEPARKISTFTEMLQQRLTHPDPRTKMLLDKIESSSSRMLALIRGILTYSQLSRDNQPLTRIDLNKVLVDAREDFELLIEEKKASIHSSTLPVIEGIPVQINQLFGNLIANALKFASKVRPPVIHITAAEPDKNEIARHSELRDGIRYYRITFTDNGIGFSQHNARQIFDIFQRLHGRAEYEGTGIGLALCKKIAQNHHGDITAESVEGEGATFHVFLPRPAQDN